MAIPEKKEEAKFKGFLPRGVFREKSAISRIEFKKTALKGRYIVPGGGGKIWGKEDIKKIIEKDFPREKFGSQISRKKFQKRIDELKLDKFRAPTGKEKLDIDQKIRFYRRRFLR